MTPAAKPAVTADRDLAIDLARRTNSVLRFLDTEPGTIPVLVKDCIDVAGDVTTQGSVIHIDDAPAREDAFVVQRMRQAGCGIAGKAHLTEFCFGATGENTFFGNALHPADPARMTGGSSSGSAAAVAAGITRMALGTDTGGSVRIPAALCGVVGMRPSFGRVSNRGCLKVSTICDTIGPVAASVRECAWLFDAIAGYDPHDPCSQPGGSAAMAGLDGGASGLTIGVARGYYVEDVSQDVADAVERAVGRVERSGATLRDVMLGTTEERRAQHAVRFVAADVADARRDVLRRHPEKLGSEVRRRIELGGMVSGPDYAASIRALQIFRAILRETFESGCDVIAMPTVPVVAPPWSEGADMIATTRKLGAFTYDIGATGYPSISVPCGFGRHELPVGLQFVAPWGREDLLVRAAQALAAAV